MAESVRALTSGVCSADHMNAIFYQVLGKPAKTSHSYLVKKDYKINFKNLKTFSGFKIGGRFAVMSLVTRYGRGVERGCS